MEFLKIVQQLTNLYTNKPGKEIDMNIAYKMTDRSKRDLKAKA
ncbi:MAG: hypothetical protein AAGI25_07835 [Bacteroidota bacterium]